MLQGHSPSQGTSSSTVVDGTVSAGYSTSSRVPASPAAGQDIMGNTVVSTRASSVVSAPSVNPFSRANSAPSASRKTHNESGSSQSSSQTSASQSNASSQGMKRKLPGWLSTNSTSAQVFYASKKSRNCKL